MSVNLLRRTAAWSFILCLGMLLWSAPVKADEPLSSDSGVTTSSSTFTEEDWKDLENTFNEKLNEHPGLAMFFGSGLGAAFGAMFGVFLTIMIAVAVLMLISHWKIFSKAGEPGWACLIPIYNVIVFLKVAGKPWWWLFLFCLPIVNLIMGIIALNGLSKNFGKDAGFTVGLLFLPIIFFPILAFGKSKYKLVK